jgi:hypothetical protein
MMSIMVTAFILVVFAVFTILMFLTFYIAIFMMAIMVVGFHNLV